MRKARVFISFKMTKLSIILVRILEEFLKRNGYEVYIAVDNPEHNMLSDKLKREILKSDLLIAIIEKGKQSPSVHQEIGYAEDRIETILMVDKRIIDKKLGALIDGRELEPFDKDNFEFSIKRAYRSIQKKIQKALEANTSPHMITSQPPITQNSLLLEPAVIPQSSQSDDYAGSPRFTYEEPVICKAPPVWYRKDSEGIKMITDDIGYTLRYGNTWGACQASLPIHNRTIWITAIVDTSTGYIITHLLTMTKPDADAMSNMFQIAQMVAKTPETIKTDLHPTYSKAIKSAFETTGQWNKDKQLTHRHHNESLSGFEEYLGSMLVRILKYSSEYSVEEFESMAQYEIINHNYIQPLGTLGRVPATAAEFGLRFVSFDDIRSHALSYEKAFINKLGSKIHLVKIHVSAKNKKIYIELKPNVKKFDRDKIDLLLQECGFQLKNEKWTRKSSFLDLYAVNFRNRGLPVRTFEMCDCGKMARSLQEVLRIFGFRNGKVIKTQPSCRKCRYGSDTPKICFRARLDQPPDELNTTILDFIKDDAPDKARKCTATEPCKDYSWLLERGRQMPLSKYQACC